MSPVRTLALLCAALLVSSALLRADDHSVIFDPDVNFSSFKTFTMRDARLTSARPELNFPLVIKTINDAIRTALTTAGLKEAPAGGDLSVALNITGVDYGIGPFGRASAVSRGRGRGGASSLPVDFTEVTLVLDLEYGNPAALVWRGVYHDTEGDAQKLAAALPKDAAKLLAEYPPKKK